MLHSWKPHWETKWFCDFLNSHVSHFCTFQNHAKQIKGVWYFFTLITSREFSDLIQSKVILTQQLCFLIHGSFPVPRKQRTQANCCHWRFYEIVMIPYAMLILNLSYFIFLTTTCNFLEWIIVVFVGWLDLGFQFKHYILLILPCNMSWICLGYKILNLYISRIVFCLLTTFSFGHLC